MNLTLHLHQLYSQHMPDAHAVPVLRACGAFLAHLQCAHGAYLACLLCAHGACLARPWCTCGACLAHA